MSLKKPLHYLPPGSSISAFARQEKLLLEHLHSCVAETAVGSVLSFSAFSRSVNFVSTLQTSWLHSKYNFHNLDRPGVARWDPMAEYSGNSVQASHVPHPVTSGHALRSSLATRLSLDLRDDPLLPAHGVLLSAGHKVSCNHSGQHNHKVSRLQTCGEFV